MTSPIIDPGTMEHLEDALDAVNKSLEENDIPLFVEQIYPGSMVADFYNSSDWMKARVLD